MKYCTCEALEGRVAHQHLKDEHAQRPVVGSARGAAPHDHLGSLQAAHEWMIELRHINELRVVYRARGAAAHDHLRRLQAQQQNNKEKQASRQPDNVMSGVDGGTHVVSHCA
jgi:hypothetical protein